MENKTKIAIIGGGSWATALVKILSENNIGINWYIRNSRIIEYIKKRKHNPNYLSSVEFDLNKIVLTNKIDQSVKESEMVLFAVPAAFLEAAISKMTIPLENKFVISAIKGIMPENNMLISEYFEKHHKVPIQSFAAITGPCHAEEVAQEKLSYLTVVSENQEKANLIKEFLDCNYINAKATDDVIGAQFASVLKNIYAIAAGICHGLGYGDNFQAVLVSNAIIEMKRFVRTVHPLKRDIKGSAYLGDLMVTTYSQFSRNRIFGNMIGKGYSVKSAQFEMNMIAEGFYAAKGIHQINKNYQIEIPIVETVYNILYRHYPARKEMQKLTNTLS